MEGVPPAVEEALQLQRKGDTDAALAIYRRLDSSRTLALAHAVEVAYQAAWIQQRQGRAGEAEQWYQRCIGFTLPLLGGSGGVPRDRETVEVKMRLLQAHYGIAVVQHSQKGKRREAKEHYSALVELYSECIAVDLEGIAKNCGSEEAVKFFTVKELKRSMAYALCNLALARLQENEDLGERSLSHEEEGDLRAAMLQDYERAKDADPRNTQTRSGIAALFMESGEWEEAAAAWQEQVPLEPASPLVHYNLGLCFQWMAGERIAEGKGLEGEELLTKAVESYERAVNFDPEFAMAYCNMAEAMRRLGDVHASVDHYQKAIDLFEESTDVAGVRKDGVRLPCRLPITTQQASLFHHNMAMALKQLGKTFQALAAFKKAIHLDQGNAALYISCADCLMVAGRAELHGTVIPFVTEALMRYQTADSLKPSSRAKAGVEEAQSMLHQLEQ